MSIVVLQLPEVKSSREDRPKKCPYCSGETFQRWGQTGKPIRDSRVSQVLVYRYRCTRCRRTFRHYPEGVDRASQSLRLRQLASLSWVLGLSYRGVVGVFAAFGVDLGRMSAWRDVQDQAGQRKKQAQWGQVRVLGLDGAYVRGWGGTQAVLVAVDLGTGQPVALGAVDEKDPQAVKKFLEPLVQRLGVSVVVTDDLASYKKVTEQLGLEQQICQFHLRRWVGRALWELEPQLAPEWQKVVHEVKQLVTDLPAQGDKRLLELYRQIPESRQGRMNEPYSPLDQLRHLLARMMTDWAKYRTFFWQAGVPWTNNGTERAIGRMKLRARTVRGYKTEAGMLNGLWVSGMGWA
jgi:transposase-like protein